MKSAYKQAMTALTVIALTGAACGQNAKVKTITIINGDTTVSEKEPGDPEIADIEKQITMMISDDGDPSQKKVIKKIIINGDGSGKEDTFAYAYGMSDQKGEDVEITTDDNDKETKIIIKKGGKKKADDKKENTTISRSVTSSSENGKESMSLNVKVTNNVAKVEVESGSREPLNISILDENGKQVFYESQKTGGKYSKEIKLEKGTYFMNVVQNKKSTTDKIVIQ
jgi:hypothetical protein